MCLSEREKEEESRQNRFSEGSKEMGEKWSIFIRFFFLRDSHEIDFYWAASPSDIIPYVQGHVTLLKNCPFHVSLCSFTVLHKLNRREKKLHFISWLGRVQVQYTNFIAEEKKTLHDQAHVQNSFIIPFLACSPHPSFIYSSAFVRKFTVFFFFFSTWFKSVCKFNIIICFLLLFRKKKPNFR